MKGYQSDAVVLFTLPPDGNKFGKHNSDIAKVSDEICDFAKANHYATWNLAEVMGGKSSISKWRTQDLASKDFLHFSPKGYMLQGYLLYAALMKAYKNQAEAGR
jgi:lysophospholipase L1-like esterase